MNQYQPTNQPTNQRIHHKTIVIPSNNKIMDASNKENKENQKSGSSSYEVPWIEKYRPQKLEDVVGNEETLIRLQSIAKDGNLPNLILCGPPGTGKVCLGLGSFTANVTLFVVLIIFVMM
jgi:predicted ATPase with chaperone activity